MFQEGRCLQPHLCSPLIPTSQGPQSPAFQQESAMGVMPPHQPDVLLIAAVIWPRRCPNICHRLLHGRVCLSLKPETFQGESKIVPLHHLPPKSISVSLSTNQIKKPAGFSNKIKHRSFMVGREREQIQNNGSGKSQRAPGERGS